LNPNYKKNDYQFDLSLTPREKFSTNEYENLQESDCVKIKQCLKMPKLKDFLQENSTTQNQSKTKKISMPKSKKHSINGEITLTDINNFNILFNKRKSCA
jgi:hypothetical protein